MTEITMKYSREINLLTDKNKATVRNSLKKLLQLIKSSQLSKIEKIYFFENYLLKNYLLTISNPSDSVRELSLDFLKNLLKLQTDEKKIINTKNIKKEEIKIFLKIETSSVILKTLLNRIDTLPFKENVEEIRLYIIKILSDFLKKNKKVFKREISLTILALEKILQDNYSEIKKETSNFIKKLSLALPIELGINPKNIIIEICKNNSHQHSKVRKSSLEALTKILILPKANIFLKESFFSLRKLLSDKSSSIRDKVFFCVFECLMKFELDYLREFEDELVLMLLNGFDDDDFGIRERCKDFLVKFSDRRKELFENFKK